MSIYQFADACHIDHRVRGPGLGCPDLLMLTFTTALLLELRGVERIMAAKLELMLAILTMNHLTWDKILMYNLQFFMDQTPYYEDHMILVDEIGSTCYLHP